jgi:hypothetical protein
MFNKKQEPITVTVPEDTFTSLVHKLVDYGYLHDVINEPLNNRKVWVTPAEFVSALEQGVGFTGKNTMRLLGFNVETAYLDEYLEHIYWNSHDKNSDNPEQKLVKEYAEKTI